MRLTKSEQALVNSCSVIPEQNWWPTYLCVYNPFLSIPSADDQMTWNKIRLNIIYSRHSFSAHKSRRPTSCLPSSLPNTVQATEWPLELRKKLQLLLIAHKNSPLLKLFNWAFQKKMNYYYNTRVSNRISTTKLLLLFCSTTCLHPSTWSFCSLAESGRQGRLLRRLKESPSRPHVVASPSTWSLTWEGRLRESSLPRSS